MKIAAIIAEYNPFHNGHALHIKETKKITGCDDTIVVISGNFVQRGEPAIMDKWARTKCALLNGADMVLELPTIFASSGAEYFANGAVKIIKDTNIVDFLSFGSESGNLSQITTAATFLQQESGSFSSALKNKLNKGIPFALARQQAMEEVTKEDCSFLSSPNNILAIEYLKALIGLNSAITPITIKRMGEGYNSLNKASSLSSATALRRTVMENDFSSLKNSMPESSFNVFADSVEKGTAPIFFDNFSQSLSYALRTKTPEQLSTIADVTEGLENRILKAYDTCSEISEIMDLIKTKRYAYTKLQRSLIHILLNITSKELEYYKTLPHSPYIRVLGFKKEKEYLLGHLIENSKAPVITNIKKAYSSLDKDGVTLLNLEKTATDIYYMGAPNKKQRGLNKEYTNSMVIV